MTVSEVVAAFGGTSEMAWIFNVLPSAVSNWKREGRFPDRLHYRISRIADERGIHVPEEIFSAAGTPSTPQDFLDQGGEDAA